jgi:putative hemin transport protein
MTSLATHSSAAGALPLGVLAERWAALRVEQPNLRIRDAASRLGVTELELVASGVGKTATRLHAAWGDVIQALPSLGPVMALTRNESVVHEKTGPYLNVEISAGGKMGLTLGDAIDLRLFLSRWRYGFAVTDRVASGLRSSLQFFAADGSATHKIYLVEESDRAAYDALVEQFRDQGDAPTITVAPAEAPAAPKPDAAVDAEGFRQAWDAMTDTHEFFGMLAKFGVDRLQALRLAGPSRATKIATDVPRRLLEEAARSGLPIMVFTGNPGTLQIHTGPVVEVKPTGPWINVMDPDFNLHLNQTGVEQVWLVRKPTADGVVTSIELFDATGYLITTFFGKRKPGQPEDLNWRVLAESFVG